MLNINNVVTHLCSLYMLYKCSWIFMIIRPPSLLSFPYSSFFIFSTFLSLLNKLREKSSRRSIGIDDLLISKDLIQPTKWSSKACLWEEDRYYNFSPNIFPLYNDAADEVFGIRRWGFMHQELWGWLIVLVNWMVGREKSFEPNILVCSYRPAISKTGFILGRIWGLHAGVKVWPQGPRT